MTSCEDLYKILKNREKEKMNIELKNSNKLKTRNGPQELGYEIVAFANRHGGKLILGINDDGSFEGKGIFDIEKDKGIIDDLCHTKISPAIDYYTDFLECDEGDVFVVTISKRKGIPHAFINSRHDAYINNRIYYIRTEHGKRLVNDIQLDWLFKNQEDPYFFHSFEIVVQLSNLNFNVSPEIRQPNGNLYLSHLLKNLSDDKKKVLRADPYKENTFFVEFFPYVILFLLSRYFSKSWLIQIHRRKREMQWRGALIEDNLKKLSLDNFPTPIKKSAFPTLSWDYQTLLKMSGFSFICLPLDTEIKISIISPAMSQLELIHPAFHFEFLFGSSSSGPGIFSGHPFYENTHPYNEFLYPVAKDTIKRHLKLSTRFRYVELNCMFNAKFEFPEIDVKTFQYYKHFEKTIEDIIQNEVDFENFVKNLPSAETYEMNNKLTEILTILKDQKKFLTKY